MDKEIIDISSLNFEEVEILSKESCIEYTMDIEVENSHRYILSDGIISHNTTSLMTQTTSGIEPMFMPYYVRRKKLPQDSEKHDFIDAVGDKWEEFKVYHRPFIEWYRTQLENHVGDFQVWYDGLDYSNEEIERFFNNISKELFDSIFELSPYYKATSNDVDYFEKVRMQGRIQKWVDHSISVTINMPNNVSKEVVGECYMLAHQVGCKGMTVYRDGSRSGVLVKEEKKEEKVEIKYNNAVKRPEVVECDIYRKTVLKKDWMIIVGLLNGKPLEIFAFEDKDLNFPKHLHKGKVRKIKSRVYDLISEDLGKTFIIPDIVNLIHIDDKSDTRKYSLMLRHGIHPKFIIQQIDEYATVVSFDKAIQRVLKNYVDLNGLKGNPCPNCGLELMRVEGCEKCTCGYSRC